MPGTIPTAKSSSHAPTPKAPRVVTIWNLYGPYHLARCQALADLGCEVIRFSHCRASVDYPFFGSIYEADVILNDCPSDQINAVLSFWRTLRRLREQRPALIMTCGYQCIETLASVVYSWCHIGHRPIVLLMVENQSSDRRRHWLVEYAKRVYLRLFDGFIAGGITHSMYLRELGVVDETSVVLGYDCVDNTGIRATARSLRATVPSPVATSYFLCIARLIEKKNVIGLIRAYSKYLQSLSPGQLGWALVICGDGDQRGELERLIDDLALQGVVHLQGGIDDFREVVRYYAFASCFILASSHSEQWGLVVNEAMAAELPVLVSKECGCAPHLVDNKINGMVFDPVDIDDMTTCMSWIHDRPEAERRAIGLNSWMIVEGYSPRVLARRILRLYDAIHERQGAQ